MLRPDLRGSLVRPAVSVVATVACCAAVLGVLRPWPSDGPDQQIEQHSVTALSASVGEVDGVSATGSSRNRSKSAILEGGQAPEATEIRLARRSSKRSAVPLPEKDERVAMPVPDKRNLPAPASADETKAEPPAEPKAKAPVMPPPTGRLEKSDGDAVLAPLLAYAVSDDDVEGLKEFVKLAYAEKYSDARDEMKKLTDPVAVKFAHWYYYRKKAPDTTVDEIVAFLEENPRWPDRETLQDGVEDALFWREDDPKRVIAYFNGRPPVSGAGKAALGAALIAENRAEEGKILVREAWRKYPLTKAIEKKIRKLRVLNAEDHRLRADYLLMQDNKSYIKAAKRLLPLIDKKWTDAVKAHIATVERSKRAGGLLSRLDSKIKVDPAVLFARIQWLRRAGRDEKVWSLLRSAPKTSEKLVDPEEWWAARDSQVRLALNDERPKTAYAIAKDHGGGLEHWDLSDAEFLAGWIALRFLDKPEVARKHLLASAAAGGLPKRRARAGYWLGRTELALGDERAAIGRFAEAAQHHHTFYGQLAHQMIASTGAKVSFRTFVRPTQHEIDSFASQDVMKAIVLAQKADFENLQSLFLYDLARQIESAPEMILLCELAIRVAPRHRAVRMAKVAMNRGFPVEDYAYPDALPEFKVLADGEAIENALVHALTRQESEFNPAIVSSAGAVGLMQLLPSTAKMVARQYDLKFSKKKLSDDPAYNVALGTAFLQRLIHNYDGSYIMALAGYNAGPGRIRQWVKQFGDPRDKEVDPIDWIERIPFTETREYVHKIMESAQVYRTRLQGRPGRAASR